MSEQFLVYLFPAALVIVFAVACIFSFRRRSRGQWEVLFLSVMYWVFFLALAIGYANATGLTAFVPHLFRTAHFFTLLFMPLSYLYVRLTLTERRLSKSDTIHLMPALIYLVDYAGFFVLPASEKRLLYEQLKGTSEFSDFREGWLAPPLFHVAVRYLTMLGYWIAQGWLLFRAVRNNRDARTAEQLVLLNWIKWLTVSQLIIFVPPLVNMVFHITQARLVNPFFGICAALAQGYFLLFRPEILYGWNGYTQSRAFAKDILIPGKRGHGKVGEHAYSMQSDPGKMANLKTLAMKLEEHFRDQKPFLQQGYGLPDLAGALGCTTNQLSFLINHYYGLHFNALINRYRIEACKEVLCRGEFRQKTLEAIAQEAGFKSRTTFIKAFKDQTGKTPSDFIRFQAEGI